MGAPYSRWRPAEVPGVSALVVTATLARPLLEFTLKNLVGPRPSGHRPDARGLGTRSPAGTSWRRGAGRHGGDVVSLYVKSHRVWWITSTLSLLTIIGIGSSRSSRCALATDVLWRFIAASLLLAGLELAYHRTT